MHIRIVKQITASDIDAQLRRFQAGRTYEVEGALALLMLAEGWAEPALAEDAVLAADAQHDPLHHVEGDLASPGVPQKTEPQSLEDALAADAAIDRAIAEAIERRTRRNDQASDPIVLR